MSLHDIILKAQILVPQHREQGLKYGIIWRILIYACCIGSSENSFLMNAVIFWIINQNMRHLFQHSCVPKQIRNWTIPKVHVVEMVKPS